MNKIAIAICTHNRASSLANTLTSLRDIAIPAGVEHRVFLVVNACTDNTLETVEAFPNLLPLTIILECIPGLSYARNTALNVIEDWGADLLLWCDDDVGVSRAWLEAYWAAFVALPEINVMGGPIDPEFEAPPPAWIAGGLPVFRYAFAALDHGQTTRVMLPGARGPVGANMAFRQSVSRLAIR